MAALTVACLIVAACGSNVAESSRARVTTPSSATATTEPSAANRALVDAAVQRLWVERDLAALDEYWSPDYVEHAMEGDKGSGWFRTVAGAVTANPNSHYMQLLSLAEGDLVLSVSTDNFSGSDELDFDLVRVTDGKIAELWDATEALSTTANESGHTTTDGLAAPIGQGPLDANRSLVQGYLQTALVEGRWDDIARYFKGNTYIQHSAIAADGVDSVRAFFVGLRDAGTPFTYSDVHVVLAEGDYVLAVSRGDFGGATSTYWDLFRIQDDAIAEHWDVIEAVPPGAVDRYFSSLPR